MRVWHFVNEQFGLDDIRRRRLKIATLQDLNDPFELFGANLKDPYLRLAIRLWKIDMATKHGILCFSKNWSNPVQWSHYADKHKGLCLGFDVPDELLGDVSYSRKKLVIESEQIEAGGADSEVLINQFLFTKYAHWRYENEVRCFLSLSERDPDCGLYFADFSNQLKLSTVIVGAASKITRRTLTDVLGGLEPEVEIFKARLSFSTFKVIRQRKADMWK